MKGTGNHKKLNLSEAQMLPFFDAWFHGKKGDARNVIAFVTPSPPSKKKSYPPIWKSCSIKPIYIKMHLFISKYDFQASNESEAYTYSLSFYSYTYSYPSINFHYSCYWISFVASPWDWVPDIFLFFSSFNQREFFT